MGIEYASIFAALGTKVTLVDKRRRILEFLDDEILEGLQHHLRDLGLTFRLGEAVERLQTTTSTKGQVGYWPRHRFPKGLAPDVLAAAPELEQKLFAMKKGQVSGVESAKNMFLVFHVVDA